MTTMTPKQVESFRAIYANGLESINFQGATESDLMLLGMQFFNMGVHAALDALDEVMDSHPDAHLVGQVIDRIEEVREAVKLRNG